ncbi:MAG: hypothetical protein ACRDBO_12315 [Lachnospiraceae bacterium]
MYLGILDLVDVRNNLNLDVCFMIAGIMGIATAVQATGAGNLLADGLIHALGGNPHPLLVLVVFYFAGASLSVYEQYRHNEYFYTNSSCNGNVAGP